MDEEADDMISDAEGRVDGADHVDDADNGAGDVNGR